MEPLQDDLYSVYVRNPSEQGMQLHPAGRFLVNQGVLSHLEDYHGHLAHTLQEGPITDMTRAIYASLKSSPYLEIRSKKEQDQGYYLDEVPEVNLPDPPPKESLATRPSSVFEYTRAGHDKPHVIEAKGNKVTLDGSELTPQEIGAITANIKSGAAKLSHKQEDDLVKSEGIDLAKMAIKDIPKGSRISLVEYDYSHLLPEAYRNSHKLIAKELDYNPNFNTVKLFDKNDPVPFGAVDFIYEPDYHSIQTHSRLDPSLHNKGLGSAMYEAALAHAHHKYGVDRVANSGTSELAINTHKRLGVKHGYEVNPTKYSEAFNRYKYDYTFKSEELAKSIDPQAEFQKLQELVQKGHLDQSTADNLRKLVYEDKMTPGLGNKFAFKEFLNKPRPGVFISMDGNSFKSINDSLGHEAGDNAITHMGKAAREAMDEILPDEGQRGKLFHSGLYRNGGDEFVAHVPTFEHAAKFIRGFRDKLNQITPIGGTHKLSMSYGLGSDFASADAALNLAKNTKKVHAAMNNIQPGQEPHFAHSNVPGYEGPIPVSAEPVDPGVFEKPETI